MNLWRLIKFVIPASLDKQLMPTKLASTHDSFIMPNKIYALDGLPLTSNRKVDNKKLNESLFIEVKLDEIGKTTDASPLLILKKAISLTLRVFLREVDNTSLFWELGGNSLAAVMVLLHLCINRLLILVAQLFQLRDINKIS